MLVESVSHAAVPEGEASLGMSFTSYPTASRTDSSLDLSLKGSTGDAFGATGSLSSRFFLNGSHALALELPELYARASGEIAEAHVTFALGRKLERWSRLDETW